MRLARPALALAAAVLLCLQATLAPAIEQATPARSAWMIDLSSGTVLLEKNADEPIPPASMSKLMTLYMVFDALKSGRLSMTDEFRTTRKASKMGGSKMWIREGEVVSVANLVRGVIVQSGNDAAVALAEGMAGTEEAFARQMSLKAQQIGLTNSHFENSTGWPAEGHEMSAHDMGMLAVHLIEEFPDLYTMFKETEFTWDDITQKNRNPLLGLGIGADGLKTGHTEEAGYGLVASAVRGDRRVVLVVAGLESEAARKREAERLINWAFRAFETRTLFDKGTELARAPVWIGSAGSVGLAPAEPVRLTAEIGRIAAARVTLHYAEPVEAPIAAGTQLGEVRIHLDERSAVKIPLVATEDVARGGFLSKMEAAARLLIGRVMGMMG